MITNGSKTAIIGAGASGLAAAISLARRGADVTVYEHKDKAGLKLALTGNGKCNFTNEIMDASCYHVDKTSRVGEYLVKFSTNDAIEFFNSIGICSVSKNGYYYPDSANANDVVNALVNECHKLNVRFVFDCGQIDIKRLKADYDALILACGSFAHKKTGSNGSGYKYLETFGVKYTRVLPALCAVYCEDKWCEENAGKRIIATVTAYVDGKAIANDTGEVQVTSYGYSGIPVFQISRYISRALDEKKDAELEIDFNPEVDNIPEFLRNRYKVNNTDKRKVIVSKVADFDKSQVCTGGVSLDLLTEGFEVISCPGLYVIGEMCDVDGICGGYNLHWAWLSGNLCGL